MTWILSSAFVFSWNFIVGKDNNILTIISTVVSTKKISRSLNKGLFNFLKWKFLLMVTTSQQELHALTYQNFYGWFKLGSLIIKLDKGL